jgi:hypothetical protein
MIDGGIVEQPAASSPKETSSSGAAENDPVAAQTDASTGASCAEPASAAPSCASSSASASMTPSPNGADGAPSDGSPVGSGEPEGAGPGGGVPDDGVEGSATDGPDPVPGEGGSETNGAAGAAGASGTGGGGSAGSGDIEPPPGSDPPPEALPDLIVDGTYLMATVQEDVVDASADMCLFAEGCVNGPGLRRVVRFGTRSANVGGADVIVGRPEAGNPSWEFDACHQHYHFEGYASYELLTDGGARLPIGNKNGFCLRDLDNWTGSASCGTYDCEYQGIGVGCADVYTPDLPCQWIDITDVAAGTYELLVTVNSEDVIRESDTSNNSASVTIEIRADAVRVIP